MFAEFRSAVRPAFFVLLALTIFTGIAYPLAMTGAAQVLLPHQANGSLIRKSGRVVGSELIGQNFAGERYFHGRPSAAGKEGYDASASAATNLAPGSLDLHNAIAGRVADLRSQGLTGPVPPDLVTTSASGLDPDISPEAALSQISRVAAARKMEPATLRQLVERQTQWPLLGFLGEPRVNVLELNIELNRMEVAPRQ